MERLKPTTKQHQVLWEVTAFIKANGFSPTYSWLGNKLGLTRGAIRNHLLALEAKGYLTFTPGESRSILLKEK